jgi:transcriptional regulator with XRE-family HTH domain
VPKSLFTRKHAQLRKALTAARKHAKLTQTELAERLGRRQAYVSRIERGERRVDVVEFLDIAHAIGFDPGRFLSDFDRNTHG